MDENIRNLNEALRKLTLYLWRVATDDEAASAVSEDVEKGLQLGEFVLYRDPEWDRKQPATVQQIENLTALGVKKIQGLTMRDAAMILEGAGRA